MPFEYQAMLILLAGLLLVACFFLWVDKHRGHQPDADAVAGPDTTNRSDAAHRLQSGKSFAHHPTTGTENPDQDVVRIAIREALEERGISDLAAETGLSREDIELVLARGGTSPYDSVVRILHALGYQLRLEPRRTGPVA